MVFAHELKEKLKTQGVFVHNPQQLNEMASRRWNELTPEEKAKYKQSAKDSPPILLPRATYNSLGQKMEDVETKKVQVQADYKRMKEHIIRLISDAPGKQNNICSNCFYS